jgi:capsular polysaccharide biosynthesis protein
MESKSKNEENTIDLLHIAELLWKKIWLILLVSLATAAIAFSYVNLMVTPLYSSSVMLYVNSNNISLGSTSVSISGTDLSTARSLVKTYIVILENQTTLEEVLELTESPYSYGQLLGMISASAVDSTEVIKITVTCPDAEEAAILANGIAQVLPQRVSEIIEGSSVRLVDEARVNTSKISPDVTRYAELGFLVGFVLICAILIIIDLLDDVIHGEDVILKSYDVPVLARIPNLLSSGSHRYGKYGSYGRYGNGEEENQGDKKGGQE